MVTELHDFLYSLDPNHRAYIYIYYNPTAGFYAEVPMQTVKILLTGADETTHGYQYKYMIDKNMVFIRFLREGE